MIAHYTVSATASTHISHKVIEELGQLIQELRHHKGVFRITERQNGIYHIVFNERLKRQDRENKRRYTGIV